MSNWKPGDRALCIEDGWGWKLGYVVFWRDPKKSHVYIVDEVFLGDETGQVCLALKGISLRNLGRHGITVGGYSATCFRKIVPQCDREKLENADDAQIERNSSQPNDS
jgi:hypothetical protein